MGTEAGQTRRGQHAAVATMLATDRVAQEPGAIPAPGLGASLLRRHGDDFP